MSDQLHYLSISELSKLIETKVISPVEVTKLLLSRITAIDPELKSYATVMVDESIIEAEKNFQVSMAAPGLTKSDFNIELNDEVLTISVHNDLNSGSIRSIAAPLNQRVVEPLYSAN